MTAVFSPGWRCTSERSTSTRSARRRRARTSKKLERMSKAADAAGFGGDLNYETTVLRSFWGEAPAEAVAP